MDCLAVEICANHDLHFGGIESRQAGFAGGDEHSRRGTRQVLVAAVGQKLFGERLTRTIVFDYAASFRQVGWLIMKAGIA